jgi:16S rRNA (guanine966-N2)-methyltransferase
MTIQILGGKAKGFSLKVKPVDGLRPTSVLLRRRLFDWRQHWGGWQFIDLCAGTGAMAFEAWSRGADQVWMNEMESGAYRSLQQAVNDIQKKYQSQGQIKLTQLSFERSLDLFWTHYKNLDQESKNQTVLYFDPPYEQKEMYLIFTQAVKNASYSGEIWIESDSQKGISLKDLETLLGPSQKQVSQSSQMMLVWSF